MKPTHVAAERGYARAILRDIGASLAHDFYTLNAWQVEQLLYHADLRHYRKPRNANGSRARYFYQMIVRRAQRKD